MGLLGMGQGMGPRKCMGLPKGPPQARDPLVMDHLMVPLVPPDPGPKVCPTMLLHDVGKSMLSNGVVLSGNSLVPSTLFCLIVLCTSLDWFPYSPSQVSQVS